MRCTVPEIYVSICTCSFRSFGDVAGHVSVLKAASLTGSCYNQVWVPITTAAITAVATWNETAPLHEELKVRPNPEEHKKNCFVVQVLISIGGQMVSDAAETMDDIITQWEVMQKQSRRMLSFGLSSCLL